MCIYFVDRRVKVTNDDCGQEWLTLSVLISRSYTSLPPSFPGQHQWRRVQDSWSGSISGGGFRVAGRTSYI